MAEKKQDKNVPESVGVIMDGNRRWAKKNNLFLFRGHEMGYEKMKELIKWSKDAGVKYLTVYAFSSENWKREEQEVSSLMNLARFVFGDSKDSLRKEKIKVRCVGSLEKLPEDLQKDIAQTQKETEHYDGITLVVCISYGGREEIVEAVKCVLKSGISADSLSEKGLCSYFQTAGIPDPDFIIRTGGEMRLSNFLPWQSIYSELFFTKTLWPEFSKEEFLGILEEFGKRKRNLGK